MIVKLLVTMSLMIVGLVGVGFVSGFVFGRRPDDTKFVIPIVWIVWGIIIYVVWF